MLREESESAVVSHHPRRRRWQTATTGRRLAFGAGAAVVAAALVAGGLVLVRSGSTGCDGPTRTITLAVAPDVADPLRDLAVQWNATDPAVDGLCVRAAVLAKASSQTAAALGPTWDPARDGARPTAWIPESSLWLSVAASRPEAAAMVDGERASIASSPVVLAVRRPVAEALGWPTKPLGLAEVLGAFSRPDLWRRLGHPEWAGLRLGMSDPAKSTAGLAAVVTLVDQNGNGTITDAQLLAGIQMAQVIGAVAPGTTDFLAAQGAGAADDRYANIAAFPALERELADFGAANGADGSLVPVYLGPAAVAADYPFTVLRASWVDATASAAADRFLEYLRRPAAQDALGGIGLRAADRSVRAAASLLPASAGFAGTIAEPRPAPTPEVLSRIVITWGTLQGANSIVAALDTSGSMGTPVPGTELTRLQLLQQTATAGFGLLTNNTKITLWEFSLRRGGSSRYRRLVPYGPVTDRVGDVPRREALIGAVNRLNATGFTPLYETVYAAFREAQKNWQPNANNAVLLITDGTNKVEGGLSLAALVDRLAREQRADQPVQVISIAVGPEADIAALQRIAQATGGRAFVATDPKKAIQTLTLAFAGRLR